MFLCYVQVLHIILPFQEQELIAFVLPIMLSCQLLLDKYQLLPVKFGKGLQSPGLAYVVHSHCTHPVAFCNGVHSL